jgi:hypothetical protein
MSIVHQTEIVFSTLLSKLSDAVQLLVRARFRWLLGSVFYLPGQAIIKDHLIKQNTEPIFYILVNNVCTRI